jgi:hypothetical protein
VWLVKDLMLFLSGVSSALVVVHFFLKNYMRMHQQTKSQHRLRFQEMIGRVYHKDQIPRAKRIRGLCNLGLTATSKLSDLQKRLLTTLLRQLNQVEMCGKEGHHRWAVFALQDCESSIEQLRAIQKETEDINHYWKLTQDVSLEHEENVISTVKEFEQYQ